MRPCVALREFVKNRLSDEAERGFARKVTSLIRDHECFTRFCSSNSNPKHSDKEPQQKDTSRDEKVGDKEEGSLKEKGSHLFEADIDKQIKRISEMLQSVQSSSKPKGSTGFGDRLLRNEGTSRGWGLLTEPYRLMEGFCNWVASRVLQRMLSLDIDVYDFLEGAKDAFHIVNQLFLEGDFETLKPMVSTKLYESMKMTSEHFAKEGLEFEMTPKEFVGVYVTGFQVLKSKALESFGPEFVAEDTNRKEPFWMLIYVRFIRNEHYRLTNAVGDTIQDTTSIRTDLWTFGRPFEELNGSEGGDGWTVLSIS